MSFGAGEIAIILAVLLVVVLAMVAIVVFGFILAPRAGRGSSKAMGWWIVILVLEGTWCLGSVASILTGRFSLGSFVPPALVAGQVALYMRARTAGRSQGGGG